MEKVKKVEATPLLVQKYRSIVQIAATVGILLTIAIAVWAAYGTYFKPVEQGGMFEVHLKQSGIFGPLIFTVVQIIQVVLPVIPGGMVSVSGTAVFGYEWGFVYNFVGITIGSIIAFFLARKYGEFFVKCFVSDETYEKYLGWTRNENRFAIILALIFVLPAAPDDIMCMIAGLTTLSFKKFILIFIPTKAISTYVFTWLMQEMIIYGINVVLPYLKLTVLPLLIAHRIILLVILMVVIMLCIAVWRKKHDEKNN